MAWEKALGGWELVDASGRVIVDVSERLARNGNEAAVFWEKIKKRSAVSAGKIRRGQTLDTGLRGALFWFSSSRKLPMVHHCSGSARISRELYLVY